jgi:hypothetical protein
MTLPPAAPTRLRAAWDHAATPIVLTATVCVLLFSAIDSGGRVRAGVALFFVLVCPGLALARLLHLSSVLAEVTLAIGLSVALAGLTAGAFLYANAWSPDGTLAVLVAVTLAGLGIRGIQWLRAA